jgi:hypothetical protein
MQWWMSADDPNLKAWSDRASSRPGAPMTVLVALSVATAVMFIAMLIVLAIEVVAAAGRRR